MFKAKVTHYAEPHEWFVIMPMIAGASGRVDIHENTGENAIRAAQSICNVKYTVSSVTKESDDVTVYILQSK